MRAVVVVKNGVEILNVEVPTPKKNEVLIKVF
jgi:D-arabinose 1-dehydrogenase-like Zn-dependent alcohol dehydrogenase